MHPAGDHSTRRQHAYLFEAAIYAGQCTCEAVVGQVQRHQLQQAENQSLKELRSVLGHVN